MELKIKNRINTNSIKWDEARRDYKEPDLLPLWIADMEFESDPSILKALHSVVDEGVLGYCNATSELYQAVQNWQLKHFDNELKSEDILFTAGVMPSVSLSIEAFTNPGDAVITQTPLYGPFARSIKLLGRKLITNELKIKDGQYALNFEDFEQKIIANDVKLFCLCNPHNPGGRVWLTEELSELGEICQRNNVIVVSDEIHEDLNFEPYQHTTFMNAGEGFDDFSIVLTSPTKTFNLAGVKNSVVFIKNPQLREKFVNKRLALNEHEPNTFGLVATRIAYERGQEWLNALHKQLKKNRQLLEDELIGQVIGGHKIDWFKPQGTYLVWLDFRDFGLSDDDLENSFIHKGKVLLNRGDSFGKDGSGFFRLNIATSSKQVQEGIRRIKLSLE
ncbi:MAG: pyridoxal phosphate-dependent aminotransferase [Candidatus Ancillula sp.]|jgi:cystathionine beta-lyase|nr:pyridoxal phosphate-dependent aminotransferase [Candidatus Ancillula sp.]